MIGCSQLGNASRYRHNTVCFIVSHRLVVAAADCPAKEVLQQMGGSRRRAVVQKEGKTCLMVR